MPDPLREAFRHDSWATRRLIEYCSALDDAQLAATAPGGYGDPIATLKHICGAGAFYRSLFAGAFPDWNWQDDAPPAIADLLTWADDMTRFWEELLAEPLQPDRVLKRIRRDGSTEELAASVMLVQALHHGNVHREQVCAVITSLGLQPPDVSGWAYGYDTGPMERR